jgi:hypothetical protein
MRMPTQLTPTTVERLTLPAGREEDLPKATPRFPRWSGEFPSAEHVRRQANARSVGRALIRGVRHPPSSGG